MKALVYKSTGSWYVTKTAGGQVFNARVKGVLKIDDITSTNPVAVGDEVEIEAEKEGEPTAVISEIHQRRNYINRQAPSHKKQHHIVAANIDQSLLFVTLRDPKTSQGFIDRFLVTCEAYHVPAIIVFSKFDLYRKKELDKYQELSAMYEQIGYTVMSMSLKDGEGVEAVKALLKDKITLLSGHSGVGKSTFINTIYPGLSLKTQDVSGWSGKGLHTTTFAEMFDLPIGGKVIDTPGLREFGLVDISRQELSHYYPEMRERLTGCQFNNCLHLNEPGCAIRDALADGQIHVERYISYCNILDTIDDRNY